MRVDAQNENGKVSFTPGILSLCNTLHIKINYNNMFVLVVNPLFLPSPLLLPHLLLLFSTRIMSIFKDSALANPPLPSMYSMHSMR